MTRDRQSRPRAKNEVIETTKKMKKSTADWTRAILFALCALTWLPDWPVERAKWLRVVFPIVCAAIAVWNLIRYFKDRKAENEEK